MADRASSQTDAVAASGSGAAADMRRPPLSSLASLAWQAILPLLVFVTLWGGIARFERAAFDAEQSQSMARFQQTASLQIERIRHALQSGTAANAQASVAQLLGERRDARNVSIEILDLGGAQPRPVFRDETLRPAAILYTEQIKLEHLHWLVEISPLPGHYSLLPGPTVQALRWGGPVVGLLGALIIALLQSRNRNIRRQVLRQTAALERMNHQLEASNAALQREVARRADSERELRATTALQKAILDGSDYAIISTDIHGMIELFNPAAERIFGWRADELIGRSTPTVLYAEEELVHGVIDHASGFPGIENGERQHEAVHLQELNLRRKDGESFPATLSVSPLRDETGAIRGHLGIASDIGQQKAAESRIRFLAHYDALTELPNRNHFGQRLNEALLRCKAQDEQLAVLFIDLDRFKYVNDSLGHQAGDQLLQVLSKRFMACVRNGDLVARVGGDEFIILLSPLRDREEIGEVADRVLAALRQPVDLRGHQLTVTPSIGIALYPEHGSDGETLVKHADVAMYKAKEDGRNLYRFFDRQMSLHMSERLALESELRRALERNEFIVYYQPQLDVHSGEITGMEALLRWNHPEHGLVPPDRFIPIAEDSGLILPIGAWVLRAACAQARAWRDSGLLDVQMAVNLSARQFDQQDLPELVASVIDGTGLPPDRLELELTESLVMRDPERSSETLSRCKALGLKIAVDDFGTGYSSLAYLRRFPIDRLKIDRSFIKDVVDEPDDAAIAQTIIAMAHSLRLTVVAEGVEDEAQLRLLQRWDCDIYQGFLSSRPQPADAITSLLLGMKAARVSSLSPPASVF